MSTKKKHKYSEQYVREKILKALTNTTYRARTISGVCSEAHLAKNVVVKAIKKDRVLANNLKVYPFRSKDGRLLLTTKDRFSKESTFKERFIDFFSTKRQNVSDIDEKTIET